MSTEVGTMEETPDLHLPPPEPSEVERSLQNHKSPMVDGGLLYRIILCRHVHLPTDNRIYHIRRLERLIPLPLSHAQQTCMILLRHRVQLKAQNPQCLQLHHRLCGTN